MAATLQRKFSGGIIFVIITKIITKIIVPRNYFVTISAMMGDVRSYTLSWFVRAGFRQNGFFADFCFWAAGFFRGFSRRIFSPHFLWEKVPSLDGRNRAIVIAESLARVIAAIRIASVRWSSYFPPNTGFGPHKPCVRCAAIRIARLAFIRAVFVPRGTAEWPARVGCVRWTLATGDWRFCPSKVPRKSSRKIPRKIL